MLRALATSAAVCLMLAATSVILPAQATTSHAIPLDAKWELSKQGARIGTYGGRRAILLGTGGAIRRDVSLQDGTIEFDVMVTPHRTFVYVQFRMQSDDEHEEMYLRPHKSELADAIQYAPVWNGEGNWQLYHGPGATAPATFVHGKWMHVRLVLSGRRAALFVGNVRTPQLVAQLARDPAAGYIAFRSFEGAGAQRSAVSAAYANVSIRPGDVSYHFGDEVASQSGSAVVQAELVRHWQLSPPFVASPGPVTELPASERDSSRATWRSYDTDANGLLVIGRHVRRPAAQSAIVARLTLRADSAVLRRLHLGYSDYVTVFVNGRPVFAGDAHYSYDAPRQEGLIGLFQSSVWLPLTPGDNEILLIVNDSFGGWGLMGALGR